MTDSGAQPSINAKMPGARRAPFRLWRFFVDVDAVGVGVAVGGFFFGFFLGFGFFGLGFGFGLGFFFGLRFFDGDALRAFFAARLGFFFVVVLRFAIS